MSKILNIKYLYWVMSITLLTLNGCSSSSESTTNSASNNTLPTITTLFDDVLLIPSEGGTGTSFNDGASWTHYNKGALLTWKNLGGDYIDANGINQGTTPWATQTITDTNSIKPVIWNVTSLVQAWVGNVYKNRGFHLRYISGSGGPLDYASSEATNPAERPVLSVITQNSGEILLSADMDTTLSATTASISLGQLPNMRVRSNQNTLLWFDLSSLKNKTVVSAKLQLTTTRQFTTQATVHGIFATTTGSWDTSTPITGLANGYPNDVGITAHPDVFLARSFDTNTINDGLKYLNDTMDKLHPENYWPCNTSAPTGKQKDGTFYAPGLAIPGYTPFQGGNAVCLRVKWENGPANTQGMGNYGVSIQENVVDFYSSSQINELFVRHYVFLGDSWGENINNENGKRPGGITGRQAGTPYAAGWGGRTTNGTNGWSARGGYRKVIPTGYNLLQGYTPYALYIYHADQAGAYGDLPSWTGISPNGLIKKGRWYCIEQQVKMNTRDGLNIQGSSGANDGIIRAWVDGRLVFEKTNFRFTDMSYINIDAADFGLYYGGAGNTPYDQHMAIDNIVVSKSYIGPMKIN